MKAFLVASAILTLGTAAYASPVGLWRAKDGAEVRIAKCGSALCGQIAKARIDPATGKAARDRHDRPLTGLQILIGMQPDGSGKWSGRLYNEEDGQLYAGHLLELGPARVRIEGCALGICGDEQDKVGCLGPAAASWVSGSVRPSTPGKSQPRPTYDRTRIGFSDM